MPTQLLDTKTTEETTMSTLIMTQPAAASYAHGGASEVLTAEEFADLVQQHQHAAYSLAYRFLGSREAAEDVTQEAFLRAYRSRERFRGGSFKNWVLQIVANAARDELRSRARRPVRSLDAPAIDEDAPRFEPADPGPSPEVEAIRSDLRRSLEAALLQLPDDMRLVILLRDVHGLSYEEVAKATGLPDGTVRSRISRARARLRDALMPNGEMRMGAAAMN